MTAKSVKAKVKKLRQLVDSLGSSVLPPTLGTTGRAASRLLGVKIAYRT